MTRSIVLLILALTTVNTVDAADWSSTEVQYQLGKLDSPTFAGSGRAWTHIVTLQHASGWAYGQNFFFVDLLNSSDPDFNDTDIYTEWYPAISLRMLTGKDAASGFVRDVSLVGGLNFGASAKVIKLLPGIRLSLGLPHFAFANLDMMAYLDFSEGVSRGGAPAQDDSFIIDFNWSLPFTIGSGAFSIDGHAEYIGARDDEFGNRVAWHFLAQPQVRFDLGKAMGGSKGRVFVGTEVQFWTNKLGDPDTDEFVPQALVVWRF